VSSKNRLHFGGYRLT